MDFLILELLDEQFNIEVSKSYIRLRRPKGLSPFGNPIGEALRFKVNLFCPPPPPSRGQALRTLTLTNRTG